MGRSLVLLEPDLRAHAQPVALAPTGRTLTPRTVLGVDTDHAALVEIEHALLDLDRHVELPGDTVVCTHEVRAGRPHYAVSFAFASRADPSLLARVTEALDGRHALATDATPASAEASGADLAISECLAGHGGRAVRFPGCSLLVGDQRMGDVVTLSHIDVVQVVGAGNQQVADDAVLRTRDFVRPRWHRGRLTLAAVPLAPGTYAPFEVPNPTPCCPVHA